MAKYLDIDAPIEDVKSMLVPEIPDAVSMLSQWLGLFKDSSIEKELKPMIYSYWS